MPVLEAEITILDVVEDKPLNELFEKPASEAMSSDEGKVGKCAGCMVYYS